MLTQALQAAGPFLIAALLLLAGSVVGKAATRIVISQRYKPAIEKLSPVSMVLRPETMKNMLDWTVDAAQLLGVLVAPAIGLGFFVDEFDTAVIFLYTALLILGFIGTFVFVNRVNPVNYGQTKLGWRVGGELRGIKKWRGFTPITIFGVAVNVAAAVVAASLNVT